MRIEELKNAIQEEITVLNNQDMAKKDDNTQEEIERYKAVIESLKIKKLKDLDKIKISEFAILYLHSLNPEKWSVQELDNVIYSSLMLFENSTTLDYEEKTNTLLDMIVNNTLDRLQENKIDISKISEINPEDINKDLRETILTLQKYEREGINMETFIPFLEKIDQDVVKVLGIVKFLKTIKEYGYQIRDTFVDDSLTKRERERSVINAMHKDIHHIKIKDIIGELKDYLEKLESSKSDKKTLSKRKERLIAFQILLDKALNKPVITNPQSIIRKIDIPELRLETLKQIYSHNLEYQEQVEKEYQEIATKKETKYQKFLKAFDLPEDNIENLIDKPVEELMAMYPLLVSLGIKDRKKQEELLRTSTLSRLSGIKILQNKGVITPDFIAENHNLFQEDKKEFEDLTKNINFLLSLELRPTIISKHQEILLSDPDILSENVGQLQEYELPIDWAKNQDVSFLAGTNLENKIDKWIELGYETLLEHNVELLNYSKESMRRLEVLKAIDIPLPETKEELETILTSPSFIIPEQEIDTYIQSEELKEERKEINPHLEAILQPFESTRRTYQVEGQIFSKRKTLRNLSQAEEVTKETVLNSMVAGTNLLLPEVEKVRNSLQGYNYRKQ